MTRTINTGRIDCYPTREDKINQDRVIIYGDQVFEITTTIFLIKIMIPQYFVPVVHIWYLDICSRQYWQSLWKSDPSIQTSVRTIIEESNLNNLFNFMLSSLIVKERIFNVQTLIAESFCLNGTVLFMLVLFGSGCCSWVKGSIEMFGWGFIIF